MESVATKRFKQPKIVVINGVSSVGKTSVAKAIQNHARGAFLHVQMDDFLRMLPRRALESREGLVFERIDSQTIDVKFGDLIERALAGMRSAVASMAECGNNMVIDDVFLADEDVHYRRLLSRFEYRLVGLFAPLEIVQERERVRGDRDIGLAKGQYERVHTGRIYDLKMDTSQASPDQIALEICEAFSL
ncbi:zeta toxin family protein (plasmid) [Erythrobacteraceae bacterium WH01K]|nr:zeta toxin family protein [Erythrobacteraceae bacterium WH01K]